MDIVSILQSASPFIALLFAAMWTVNRVLQFKERVRGDPKFDVVVSCMSRIDEHIGERAKKDADIVQGLTRIEAVLLQNGSILHQSQARSDSDEHCPTSAIMSMRNQRLMIEYQWAWCRDEFVKIITKSIRSNGIEHSGDRVARRVVSAWSMAAKDAKDSLDRLDGVTQYKYDSLFACHATTIMQKVWVWALPLYHRDINGVTLDQALDDLAIRLRQAFDAELTTFFTHEEDPETGHYRGKKSNSMTSGEFSIADSMSAEMRAYRKGTSSYTTGGYTPPKEAI